MISIKKMDKLDVPQVSELLCLCYQWLGEQEKFPTEYINFLIAKRGSTDSLRDESGKELYFVACKNKVIEGMISLKENEITKLYVRPNTHRQGIGKALFQTAEKIIKDAGYTEITLGAIGNSPVPFYKAMGMYVTGSKECKGVIYPDKKIILMKKILKNV